MNQRPHRKWDRNRGENKPKFTPRPRTSKQDERPQEDHHENYVVGRRAAIELLTSEDALKRIEKVYLAHGVEGHQIGEILHHVRKQRIAHTELDRNKFRELERRAAGGVESQGVIVLVAQRGYQELEELLKPGMTPAPLLVALDGIEDPHNIGAILRSAEASGSTGVLIAKRGAVLTPAVYKSSAGAAAHVPIVKFGNLDQTIACLRDEFGIVTIGLAGEGEKTIYETDLTRPICLVTGSEEKGLHRLIRERCDELIRIPLAGRTESLNASVATAVALFEAVRQRQQTPEL